MEKEVHLEKIIKELLTYRRATTRRAILVDATTSVAAASVAAVALAFVCAVLGNDIVKCHIKSSEITHFVMYNL